MLVDVIIPPVASIIVARAMGPTKLGSFSYVMWLSTAMMALGGGGLQLAARKHLADAAGKQRPDLFRAVLRTCSRYQIGILSLLALGGLALARWGMPSSDCAFASLTMIAILPGGAMSMATAVNNSVQEVRPNVVASVLSALVHTAGMILTVALGWGLIGLAAAHLASRTCDCLVRWKLTAARLPRYLADMGTDPSPLGSKPALPPGLGKIIGSFAAESTVLTLLTLVVWNRSEMFFLKRYCSLDQVAYFAVAFGLSLMPGQLVGPFSRAAGVSVYAERGRDARAGVHVAQVYWRYAVLLVLPACFGLAMLSGPLLRLLYGVRYLQAAPVLMLAASLSMFGPLSDPASSLVIAAGGQRRLVVVSVIAGMGTLILDYFLVRAYAAMGGALANGLGQAISTTAVIILAHRHSFRISPKFVLRVAGAVLGMTALVAAAVRLLPDIAAVIVGPPLGFFAYGLFLRLARVVDENDVERMLQAESLLPRSLRATFRRLLRAVSPASAPVPDQAPTA